MSNAYFSQMGEDKYLDTQVFFGKSHGVFVDIGAYDGITFSNTYFFEKYRNWTGLCVEPLPDAYEQLQHNRTAVCVHGAIAQKKGKQEFLTVSGKDNAGMFSGLLDHYDARHLDHVKKEAKKRGGKTTVVQIPTYPLSYLFKKHGITHVDYCSIDTEGSELAILSSIDFSAVDIDCFSIEDLFDKSEVRDFLADRGYRAVQRLDKDVIFTKEAAKPVKKVARKTPHTLSVVIHTKNEERMIEECIDSCKAIADQIIVADMHSSDATVQKAQNAGATVIHVQDHGFADPARNEALAHATGDWTLVLDADERLTPALRKTITKILAEDLYDVVQFPRKNIMLGKWIEHGIRWPDYQIRLFRKGFAHWEDTIHMAAQYVGRMYTLPPTEQHALVHYHSANVKYLADKTYLQASLERYYDTHPALDFSVAYARMTQEFPWRFYEHEGYKDGMHGLIANKFMEYYRFLEFAMYWERAGKPEMATEQELYGLYNTQQELLRVREELRVLQDSKLFKLWGLYTFLKKLIGK